MADFTNIWELLADMKASGYKEIYSADVPPYYGWVAEQSDGTVQEWRIRLHDANSSMGSMGDDYYTILKDHFHNRSQIVQLLNDLPFLDRLDELKSFW